MTIALTVATLLLSLMQPAGATVRMRLFSLQQPSSIQLTRGDGSVQLIRVSGSLLLVNDRREPSPLRVSGPVTIQPAGGEPFAVQYPLEISARGGVLLIVGNIPREDYVAGVLAGEASVFRAEEALKAMAVAARTYAVRFLGRHQNEGFDFCDTTHCQDYRGVATTARVRKAVTDTSGELVWYGGSPIDAYYHQDCGGITEARTPYLPQIHDAFCVAGGRRAWSAAILRGDLQSVLKLASIDNVAVQARTPAGRAAVIRIEGPVSRVFPAEEFRLALGRVLGWDKLRSDLYDVRRAGDRFIFEGYGAGHGIGLCQHGAAAMGEAGRSYRQILAYYYPDTVVGTTAQGIKWIRSSSTRADLETTRSQDASLLDVVGRLMRLLEASTGRRYEARPTVRVYPSLDAYRDATGEPGWVAASTRNAVIRLQPVDMLRSRNALDSTLLHELAHILVESNARANLPLWFREGLVLWLTQPRMTGTLPQTINASSLEQALERPQSETQLRLSYRLAQQKVESLVRARGKDVVLGWIEKGVPWGL
jgi:stage II sporulation protein D